MLTSAGVPEEEQLLPVGQFIYTLGGQGSPEWFTEWMGYGKDKVSALDLLKNFSDDVKLDCRKQSWRMRHWYDSNFDNMLDEKEQLAFWKETFYTQ